MANLIHAPAHSYLTNLEKDHMLLGLGIDTIPYGLGEVSVQTTAK